MADLHWTLDSLPERYRKQVEQQLGIAKPEPKPSPQPQPIKERPKFAPKADRTLSERVGRARTTHHMSHTEERFRDRFCASRGWRMIAYEPVSIWISGGFRYTPDFLVENKSGELMFVETKGSYRLKSHERARLAFANASTRTPQFVFCWAKEDRRGKTFHLEFWKAGQIMKNAGSL